MFAVHGGNGGFPFARVGYRAGGGVGDGRRGLLHVHKKMNGLVVQDFEIEIGGKSNAKKIGGKKLGRGRRWQVVVSKWDVHHLRDLNSGWGQADGDEASVIL